MRRMKKIKRRRRKIMKLKALGENGEWHKIEPILANFQPTHKKFDPKSTSLRAWNGKKSTSRYCPFKLNVQI